MNISHGQRIHALIENRLAGKDNDASWKSHAGLYWKFYDSDQYCPQNNPDCFSTGQGLYNSHESLEFSDGSRYLPLYHLAWDDDADNRYTYQLQNISYNLGSAKKRRRFWRQLHSCLYTRSNEYQSVRFTNISKDYNTSCLDETQADSNIRQGEIKPSIYQLIN